jgi:hypothetical protein
MTFCLSLLLVLPASEPTFTVRSVDGASLTGSLREIGDDWTVVLTGQTAARTPGDDLLSLRRIGLPLPPFPTGPQVLFANGDRLAGTVREIVRERVAFTPALGNGPELSLPLSALSVLWLAEPAGEPDAALLRRRLLAGPRSRDAVWLRNGDVIEGTLTGLDRDGLHVDADRKPVVIERNKVAYIALNTELARTLRPKGTHGRLTLADGSRLSLASVKADAQSLTGRTLFGGTVPVPVEQVVALDLRGGTAVYLSDVKPRAYKHVPWSSGLTWPYVADGSVSGQDLHLGGGTYDKGIGMHCGSELTFALGGTYRRFEAVVGLDDQEGQGGIVRLRVLVDGKPRDLGWDKELTARDGPQTVRIDVAGGQELTLVVERGRGGWWDQQGHVNWVDAQLVK